MIRKRILAGATLAYYVGEIDSSPPREDSLHR